MTDQVSAGETTSALTSDEEQRTSQNEVNPMAEQVKESSQAETSNNDNALQQSCREMFDKISDYLKIELSASLGDYELLEKLNKLTKTKYNEMDNMTVTLLERMKIINDKYAQLQPYLEMIDKVDTSVTNLEQAAYKLDAYSKELEARFRKLEKTASTS